MSNERSKREGVISCVERETSLDFMRSA